MIMFKAKRDWTWLLCTEQGMIEVFLVGTIVGKEEEGFAVHGQVIVHLPSTQPYAVAFDEEFTIRDCFSSSEDVNVVLVK
jgi:hypothetical protein